MGAVQHLVQAAVEISESEAEQVAQEQSGTIGTVLVRIRLVNRQQHLHADALLSIVTWRKVVVDVAVDGFK